MPRAQDSVLAVTQQLCWPGCWPCAGIPRSIPHPPAPLAGPRRGVCSGSSYALVLSPRDAEVKDNVLVGLQFEVTSPTFFSPLVPWAQEGSSQPVPAGKAPRER